jgi:hypothetical protein
MYLYIHWLGTRTDVLHIRVDRCHPHMFVGYMEYIHRLTDEYGRRAAVTGLPIFVG